MWKHILEEDTAGAEGLHWVEVPSCIYSLGVVGGTQMVKCTH